MKFCIFLVVGAVFVATVVIWPVEVLAVARAVNDTFHSAYVSHFFDKATFLVNCL